MVKALILIGYEAGDASFGTVGNSGEPLIHNTNLDQNQVFLSGGTESFTGILGFDMSADTQVPYYPPYYTLIYIICIASVEYSHSYIDLIVTGDLYLYRGLNVTTDSSLNGTLAVGGDVSLAGITELASTLEVPLAAETKKKNPTIPDIPNIAAKGSKVKENIEFIKSR